MENTSDKESQKSPSGSTEAPRFGDWLLRLPHIPLCFLGLGVYRAWIEITFVGSFVRFPTAIFAGQDVFDLSMVFVMLFIAFISKHLGTLFNRAIAYWISGISLGLATAGIFFCYWQTSFAAVLAYPCAILGGFGIGIIIAMWSETYSCLNPLRVASYYSLSIIVAALIVYLFKGFSMPQLAVATMCLPLFSLLCLVVSYRSIPTNELPLSPHTSFSFPWKPVMLMAIYGFAFGLREVTLYASNSGPHSAYGTVAVAVLIFIGVLVQGERFDFAWIYRIGLPLMVCAFLLLPSFGFLGEQVAGFCVSASYAAFSILIMLILANISYRYGVSALWLFGFERGIRLLFVFLGRQVEANIEQLSFFGQSRDLVISVLIVLTVLVVSLILYSERELSSRWGVTFLKSRDEVANAAMQQRQSLVMRCSELAREFRLSQREEEVLLLLVQHKTIANIERDLFIANGTAKAHVRHIYSKLGIHTREELFVLTGREREREREREINSMNTPESMAF
jgi:DNA-binding CsgD family transcriptional regulator